VLKIGGRVDWDMINDPRLKMCGVEGLAFF
jgi:hypothetical protein